jgi:sigma-B regulation protein RsbU (phosphoserine phosphatase)
MLTDKPADILLVDDNPANLRLLSEILGSRGYRVRAVTSGERALASIAISLPDIMLLDIRMPGMDGYEVCAQIKADARTSDIPIIFISALDEIQDKMKAFSVGGVDYVSKPFQMEEVMARVETHLALRRLHRELQEANQRMQNELALAAQVQASFMTQTPPTIPGWQLAVSLIPARLTSGDFYQMTPLPDGRLAILVADVVDKGVGAALYMAMSCALLRTFIAEHSGQPELVCQVVNERLIEYTAASQFVTVFLGILDTASGTLTYSNAGHNPPVILSPSQDEPRLLRNTGLPLGMFEEAGWQTGQTRLEPNDLLILYTDGITEAENEAYEAYELARLIETARTHSAGSAESVRDAILANVNDFTNGRPLGDDIALMVIRRE